MNTHEFYVYKQTCYGAIVLPLLVINWKSLPSMVLGTALLPSLGTRYCLYIPGAGNGTSAPSTGGMSSKSLPSMVLGMEQVLPALGA